MASSFLIPTSAFTLLFFLISFTPTIVTSSVLDVNGDFVTNGGGRYYMLPYKNPIGAGPITWVTDTNSCPLLVTKQPFTEQTRYSSVTLHSPYMSMFIPEGPISIKFNDVDTPCEEPLWWFIKPTRGLEKPFLNMAAGESEVDSFALVIEDAKIKGKHVYQLQYCEFVNDDAGKCVPVVVKPDNSGLLGVMYGTPNGLRPFQFEFVKATFPSQARQI